MSSLWVVGLAFLVPAIGAAIGVVLGGAVQRKLELLGSIATGALLAVIVFDIIPESHAVLPWPAVVASGLLGFFLLFAIGRNVSEVCPACGVSHHDSNRLSHDTKAFGLVAAAVGAHCVLDGIAVVAGGRFGGGDGLALGVLLHKFPEGVALSVLLLSLGFSRYASFWRACVVQVGTLAGSAIGLMAMGRNSQTGIATACAFVGGGFFYLVWSGLKSAAQSTRPPFAFGLQIAAFALTSLLLAASAAG